MIRKKYFQINPSFFLKNVYLYFKIQDVPLNKIEIKIESLENRTHQKLLNLGKHFSTLVFNS